MLLTEHPKSTSLYLHCAITKSSQGILYVEQVETMKPVIPTESKHWGTSSKEKLPGPQVRVHRHPPEPESASATEIHNYVQVIIFYYTTIGLNAVA